MQFCLKVMGILYCCEYCDGNVVEFYCLECVVLFCSCCYEREYCGSEWKVQYGKLIEFRVICSEYKYIFDYFNLILFQLMCIICKKESVFLFECVNYVIEYIEIIVLKLRFFMEKKL